MAPVVGGGARCSQRPAQPCPGIAVSDLLRLQLADVGREFYGRGWMLGTAGNLSARLSTEPVRYVV
ncbi:MAG: class II aldolase/adducin family protein, partial [Myxococcales bacterium]|nr:class II aldolase/adducin family protein [Myxococcales bacterium]